MEIHLYQIPQLEFFQEYLVQYWSRFFISSFPKCLYLILAAFFHVFLINVQLMFYCISIEIFTIFFTARMHLMFFGEVFFRPIALFSPASQKSTTPAVCMFSTWELTFPFVLQLFKFNLFFFNHSFVFFIFDTKLKNMVDIAFTYSFNDVVFLCFVDMFLVLVSLKDFRNIGTSHLLSKHLVFIFLII